MIRFWRRQQWRRRSEAEDLLAFLCRRRRREDFLCVDYYLRRRIIFSLTVNCERRTFREEILIGSNVLVKRTRWDKYPCVKNFSFAKYFVRIGFFPSLEMNDLDSLWFSSCEWLSLWGKTPLDLLNISFRVKKISFGNCVLFEVVFLHTFLSWRKKKKFSFARPSIDFSRARPTDFLSCHCPFANCAKATARAACVLCTLWSRNQRKNPLILSKCTFQKG